jgi:hypothetical protein
VNLPDRATTPRVASQGSLNAVLLKNTSLLSPEEAYADDPASIINVVGHGCRGAWQIDGGEGAVVQRETMDHLFGIEVTTHDLAALLMAKRTVTAAPGTSMVAKTSPSNRNPCWKSGLGSSLYEPTICPWVLIFIATVAQAPGAPIVVNAPLPRTKPWNRHLAST